MYGVVYMKHVDVFVGLVVWGSFYAWMPHRGDSVTKSLTTQTVDVVIGNSFFVPGGKSPKKLWISRRVDESARLVHLLGIGI